MSWGTDVNYSENLSIIGKAGETMLISVSVTCRKYNSGDGWHGPFNITTSGGGILNAVYPVVQFQNETFKQAGVFLLTNITSTTTLTFNFTGCPIGPSDAFVCIASMTK